jgi:hypothetical protein
VQVQCGGIAGDVAGCDAGVWRRCSGLPSCLPGLECRWLQLAAAFMPGCRNSFGHGQVLGGGLAGDTAGCNAGGWHGCSGWPLCMPGLECHWLQLDAAFMHGCRNPFGGWVSPKSDGFAHVPSLVFVSALRPAAEEHEAIREHKVQLRRSKPAFGPEVQWPLQCCRVLAASRRRRNRLRKALHGNPAVVVANIGALSNLRLAVRSRPDVALLQELWATAAEVRQEAKERGFEAACAEGNPCLAAVLFRPGQGQQTKLPPLGEFTARVVVACVSL